MNYLVIKRAIDIIASLVALLVLWPFFLLIAIAIRLESPGNPFFFQVRVGKGGRPFHIVKFRSMVKDAPRLGSWQTQPGDPRITRIGKLIRRTSIDELPQLWNVLVGDMSLIGPRPSTPAQESLYTPGQWRARQHVRPGITGLAQSSGRSALTLEQEIGYDMQYAAQPGFSMDAAIVVGTIRQVLARRNTN